MPSGLDYNCLAAAEGYWPLAEETDVVFDCDGGLIHANKQALMDSCAYFGAMFSHDTLESRTSRVKFPIYNHQAMRMVIDFLITRNTPTLKIDVHYDVLYELTHISHLMQIEDLFDFCWSQMITYLQVEDFPDIWAFAEAAGLLRKHGCLENYANINIGAIAKIKEVEIFTFTQMKKLIAAVNHSQFDEEIIECVLNWKETGHSLQESVLLLRQLDLKVLRRYLPKYTSWLDESDLI